MNGLWARLKHEFFEVLPPTIFFLLTFHIVLLDRILMLRQYNLSPASMTGAAVLALLVGKIVLIVDKFPFVNRFPDRPLAYNIVWKTAIYVVAASGLHFAERLASVWWEVGQLSTALRRLRTETVWPHIWAIQLWLVVLILVYCALRELVRVIGAKRVRRMFFGPLPY